LADSHPPATWLVENVSLLPRGLPVLDVASGAGRNALFLAAAGWHVHAVDRDADALATLRASADVAGVQVSTEVLDLENSTTAFGEQEFGGVVVFNYLHRPLVPGLIASLAVGGVLIYETFTIGQEKRGHPKNPLFLLNRGELAQLVAPLAILRSREGDFEGRLIASIVAQRR
jgi:SAM-dependent methyltransferase